MLAPSVDGELCELGLLLVAPGVISPDAAAARAWATLRALGLRPPEAGAADEPVESWYRDVNVPMPREPMLQTSLAQSEKH